MVHNNLASKADYINRGDTKTDSKNQIGNSGISAMEMVNNYKKKQSSKKLLSLEFKPKPGPKRANSMAVRNPFRYNKSEGGESTDTSTGKAQGRNQKVGFPQLTVKVDKAPVENQINEVDESLESMTPYVKDHLLRD
jgi:hypothetical protein